MIIELSPVEARIIGSLVEKAITTREQYPLTFNSLLNACNQKSSRDPVMELTLDELGRAAQSLVEKKLIERVQSPGDRVPKFRHYMNRLIGTDDPKVTGIMTVLLLRGPQTPGEIKNRTDRMCEFSSTAEVEGLLQELASRTEAPLVARMARQSGQKESRYTHLFFGVPTEKPAGAASELVADTVPQPAGGDRLASIERRLAELEALVKSHEERLGRETQ